jgi:hypothetical protein
VQNNGTHAWAKYIAYGNTSGDKPTRRLPENNKSFSGQGLLKHYTSFYGRYAIFYPFHTHIDLYFFPQSPRASLSSLTVLDAVYLYLNPKTVLPHSLFFFYIRWKNAFSSCVSLDAHCTTLIHRHP